MASGVDPGCRKQKLSSQTLVVKEGFLNKKGGILKGWSRRYFMLNKQSLVYFRKEQEVSADDAKSDLRPMGRIFLSDIVSIGATKEGEHRKEFLFTLHTKKRVICLQAFSGAEQGRWVAAIRGALESEGEAEKRDPFRRTLRRLAPGLKRVTLMKDPVKGIGCTIKSAAGHIFVNRVIEDGPIALTGVLRPDDEILDVNGVTITGMTVAEVGQAIRNCPDEFLATVRPITTLKRLRPPDVIRVNYITVLPNLGSPQLARASGAGEDRVEITSSSDSLDDVGNYDDEDEEESESSTHQSSPLASDLEEEHSSPSPRTKRVHVYEDVKTNYTDVLITDSAATVK